MTQPLLFPLPDPPTVPVEGEDARYPIFRIFCVGRNFAEHAREMGHEVDREAPFYFSKPANAYVASGAEIPYPPGTNDLHYEMEFVVALGRPVFEASPQEAEAAVLGYACGIDLTRRDLQAAAKAKGRPWDLAKGFENSAVLGRIRRKEAFGSVENQRIELFVNDERRQGAHLSDMIWSVRDLVADLSRFYHLRPGDLIYTGTPAGVGAVGPGDVLRGEIDGLEPIELTIAPRES